MTQVLRTIIVHHRRVVHLAARLPLMRDILGSIPSTYIFLHKIGPYQIYQIYQIFHLLWVLTKIESHTHRVWSLRGITPASHPTRY